ncbi:MAG: IclR family transcriptional regulator [Burkholderiaceae bacterium]|jgi:DNA-binding IclR family transcriptional regulator
MSKIVERTLDIFEVFAAQKRPLSVTDLARLLDIPTSSCHDVIRALQNRGYAYETGPRAGFYPTRRMYDLCEVIAANDSVVQRARVLLEGIRDELQETVCLASANGLRVVYLLVLEPAQPLRFSVRVGSEIRSVYATSAGKAVLGSLDDRELEDTLASLHLKRFTRKTIISRSRLLEDIREATARGWFLNQEESLPGVVTISRLFLSGNSPYVITVAGPTERMQAKLERAAQSIVRAGNALSNTSS